MKIYYYEGYKV